MPDNPTQLLKEMNCCCRIDDGDTGAQGTVVYRCLRCRCLAAVEEMEQRLSRVEMKLAQKEEFITNGQVELMKTVNSAVDKARELHEQLAAERQAREKAEAALARESSAHLETIDSRDHFEERIVDIGNALVLDEEALTWSSLNDVSERCIETAEMLTGLRSHKWTDLRPKGDGEQVRHCSVCGMEDTCEDPLPLCPGEEAALRERAELAERRLEAAVGALRSLRDEVSAGPGEVGEELKPGIHHEAVILADKALALAGGKEEG